MRKRTLRYLARLRLRLEAERLAMRCLHMGNHPGWRIAMRAAGSRFPRKRIPPRPPRASV
jgi:hypothetical protein